MSTLSSVVLVLAAVGAARVARLLLRYSRRALARLGWLLVRLDGARSASSALGAPRIPRDTCDPRRRQLLRVVRGSCGDGASGTADTEIDVPALRRK